MGQGPETTLVYLIRREIARTYPTAFIIKIHGSPFQASGLPDLFVFIHGRAYGLEVKAVKPTEHPDKARDRATMIQRLTIRNMRRAGCRADVVTSAAEAMEVIRGSDIFLETPDTLDRALGPIPVGRPVGRPRKTG